MMQLFFPTLLALALIESDLGTRKKEPNGTEHRIEKQKNDQLLAKLNYSCDDLCLILRFLSSFFTALFHPFYALSNEVNCDIAIHFILLFAAFLLVSDSTIFLLRDELQ